MHETGGKCIEMSGPKNGTILKHDTPQEHCELGAIVVGAVPAIFCAGTELILCLRKYPRHNAVHT